MSGDDDRRSLDAAEERDERGGPAAIEVCPWIGRYRVGTARAGHDLAKRVLDLLAVLALAPAAVALVAGAALAIKASSPGGPILHRQRRTGYRGRTFTVLKLRTMVPDAEARKAELAHLNERRWPDFKIADDPRILPVGRFLRSTGLDELPQLWNVARGDMALVGPRPTTLGPGAYQPWQLSRFTVRPGLTGLWQVTARHDPSFVQRTRLDLAYLRRRSLLLDLEILARTVLVTLRGDGA